MFTQDSYYDTYNIESFNIVDGLPPVYELKRKFCPSLMTTSPFVTDTEFPQMDKLARSEYADKSIELCEKLRASYLLIKTRLPELACSLGGKFEVTEGFITTILHIDKGEDCVWKHLISSKVRNHVRKGYRAKPEIKWGRCELLSDFYHVISSTQTQLGTPVHSRKFFSNIIRYHPNTSFIVIYLSKVPVSASLIFLKETQLYHPCAGTVKKYRPSSINNVLYWEIIKYGIANECDVFDMGRSFKGSGNERFKRSWGGNEIQLYYCYYLNRNKKIPNYNSKAMKLLTTAWKNLVPVCLAKKIGPTFIKSVP